MSTRRAPTEEPHRHRRIDQTRQRSANRLATPDGRTGATDTIAGPVGAHGDVVPWSLLVDRIGLARDIEDGTVVLSRRQLDLAGLAPESVNDLRHVVLGDRPIEVTGADSLVVSADATALREIVSDLLANAAKTSPADSPAHTTVTCTSSPPNGTAASSSSPCTRDHPTRPCMMRSLPTAVVVGRADRPPAMIRDARNCILC